MQAFFYKYGRKIFTSYKDVYEYEYIVEFEDDQTAKIQYSFNQTKIIFGNRLIIIKPVVKIFTIRIFEIWEEDQIIGRIRNLNSFKHPIIELLNIEPYSFRKVKKGFIQRFKNKGDYQIVISNSSETITYAFKTTISSFGKEYDRSYRLISGQFKSDENNLVVSLIGILLIELMLYSEQN